MRTRLLRGTAIAILMAGSSAYAADLDTLLKAPPPAPQFSWSGCHVGVNMGLGDGHLQWQDTQSDGNIDGTGTTRTAHTNLSGGVGGGQLGCDIELGPGLVMGIGGSFDWSDVAGTNQDQFNVPWTLTDHTDWFGTATGRVGAVVDRVMVYGRGGAAFAHNNLEIENSGVTLGTPSDMRTGWTLGAGLEWPFSPHWSMVLEADYYDFAAKTETFNNPAAVAGGFINPPFTINVQPSFETVTFGVNYRFGDGLGLY